MSKTKRPRRYYNFDKMMEDLFPGAHVYKTKNYYWVSGSLYPRSRRSLIGVIATAWAPDRGAYPVLVIHGRI